MQQNRKGKRRNHYVPQFYMRQFSSTGKAIHLVNTTSLKPVQNASIAHQCQQKNLWNSDLEEAFQDFEADSKKVVYQKDGDYSQVTLIDWYVFACAQYLRLPRSSDPLKVITRQVVDDWLQWQLERNPELRDVDTSYTLTGNSIEMQVSVLPDCLVAMQGLKAQVVDIESPGFILGDKPAVLYNQYCEQVEHHGHLGFNRTGIQLFMPLSPKEYLLLYDGQVYDYVKSQRVTDTDIEILNTLQIIQSESNIYFSNWADRERLLSHTRAVGRSFGYGWPRTSQCSVCPDNIIHAAPLMPAIGLDLSFLRVKRKTTRLPYNKR